MIEQCVADWSACVESGDHQALDDLLADDAVMISPVVFTPQRGKAITKMYLMGAAHALKGTGDKPFTYTHKMLDGNRAILEFETEIDGKYLNGIDIITCDDAGKITEFKVMIRPLQAINALHQKMGQLLDQMKAG